MKGCICLDIDGTLTVDPHNLPEPVLDYLHELYDAGWQFIFITGRVFSFAHATLKGIRFPYFFAVQNGADLLWMPKKKLLAQNYLSSSCLPPLEEIAASLQEDFLIYAGWEKGDFCYYRPKRFSPPVLKYLLEIQALSSRPWQAKEGFAFSAEDAFPLIKFFGAKEEMFFAKETLLSASLGEVSCIRDPLSRSGLYINLLTAKGVDKGRALRHVRSLCPPGTLFIAAGDDLNDLPLLQEADIKIAMGTAPSELLEIADLVAPSAALQGIIPALKEVI